MISRSVVSSRVLAVQPPITLRIADLAREIEGGGESVVRLETGDPDFATPAVICTAAHEATQAGHTHYANTRGLPELRRAIADKLRSDNGIGYDADTEILVTHGASHAIYTALQTLLEPLDEVLILAPYWMTYASSAVLAGGRPVSVPTDASRGFRLDLARLGACCTPRSRVLILNSPSNPTGRVLTAEELAAVARIVEAHDLTVIADEVYEKLLYNDCRHVSFAALPGMRDRTVTVNSLSKTYAMTGWRVGYLAARAELVTQMLKVAQCSLTNVAPFTQRAAVVALTDPSLPPFVEHMRQAYSRRRQLVIDTVRGLDGVGLAVPDGAFYVMLDVSRYCADSMAFSLRLLDRARVAVVPGVSLGQCAEGWVRITFAVGEPELAAGLARIAEFCQSEDAR
jgi:aspartate aminotransferase